MLPTKPDRPRSTHLASIDVWRGLACLMVVFDHAGVALAWDDVDVPGVEGPIRRLIVGASRLALGPPLFFVISGFCVAASVESSQRKGTTPFAFLGRRFWRIVPTYWVAVLGLAVLLMLVDAFGLGWIHQGGRGLGLTSPGELTWSQWFGNLTLTETWRRNFLYNGSDGNVFTRVAWTLCYQEQFYAVSALVWFLAPRRWFRGLAIATGLILVYRVFCWDSGRLDSIDGLFPTFWQEFAVGLGVYWRLYRAETKAERRGIELAIAGLLGIALYHEFASTITASSFGLLLIGLAKWDHAFSAARWLSPLRAVGQRCYSVYLVHLPIVAMGSVALDALGFSGFWTRVLMVIPTVMLVAIAASWVFHALIETRFIGRPDFTPFRSRLAAVRGRLTARIPSMVGSTAISQ